MPKSAKINPNQKRGARKYVRKFRIGPRKGGKSAHQMTNEELQKVAETHSSGKSRANARAVLAKRGVR